MKLQRAAVAACFALSAAISTGQSASEAIIVNKDDAKWTHEPNDPPGSESVFIRQDAKTGGIELLITFPAGHVIAPHYHESNERILVLEGMLSLDGKPIRAGGYAYLPAKEVQKLTCASKTRCVFYLAWDGSPKSYRAK